MVVLGEDRLLGQLLLGGFGHTEINHHGHGHASVERDQNVGGLEIPVNDPLLVRALDRLADDNEKLDPLLGRKTVPVAKLGDGHALNQFHHEVRPPGVGRPAVEHLGDVRVVHQGQGLPLGLEAGHHLFGVHPQLDNLEGHAAADRFLLLGHIHHAHAALPDLFQQLVATDHGAGKLVGGHIRPNGPIPSIDAKLKGVLGEELVGFEVCLEQCLQALAQRSCGAAGPIEEGGPGQRVGQLAGREEDRFFDGIYS